MISERLLDSPILHHSIRVLNSALDLNSTTAFVPIKASKIAQLRMVVSVLPECFVEKRLLALLHTQPLEAAAASFYALYMLLPGMHSSDLQLQLLAR